MLGQPELRDFTGGGQLTADEWKLPGGIHIVPAYHGGYIGCDRGCDFGEVGSQVHGCSVRNGDSVMGFSRDVVGGTCAAYMSCCVEAYRKRNAKPGNRRIQVTGRGARL